MAILLYCVNFGDFMAFKRQENQNLIMSIQDSDTGEDVASNVPIIAKKNDIFPTVDKLNARYNMKDISEVMSTICKSSKDISIFFGVVNYINNENLMLKETKHLHTLIQNKIGDSLPKIRLNKMLTDMVNHNMAFKIGNGKYFFNPLVITGKNQSTKQLEIVQAQWKATISSGSYVNRNELVKMINTNAHHVDGVSKQVLNWMKDDKQYSPSLPIVKKAKKTSIKESGDDDTAEVVTYREPSEEARRAFQ